MIAVLPLPPTQLLCHSTGAGMAHKERDTRRVNSSACGNGQAHGLRNVLQLSRHCVQSRVTLPGHNVLSDISHSMDTQPCCMLPTSPIKRSRFPAAIMPAPGRLSCHISSLVLPHMSAWHVFCSLLECEVQQSSCWVVRITKRRITQCLWAKTGARKVVTAHPEETVQMAAQYMAQQEVGALVITEGTTPVGIVTDRDLVTRLLATDDDAHIVTLSAVMTSNPVCVSEATSLEDAVARMRTYHIRRLVVVNEAGELMAFLALTICLNW